MAKQSFSSIQSLITTLLPDNSLELISEQDVRDTHNAILDYARRYDEWEAADPQAGTVTLDFGNGVVNNLDVELTGNVSLLQATGLDGFAFARLKVTSGTPISITSIQGTVCSNVEIGMNTNDETLLLVVNVNGTYIWCQMGKSP